MILKNKQNFSKYWNCYIIIFKEYLYYVNVFKKTSFFKNVNNSEAIGFWRQLFEQEKNI